MQPTEPFEVVTLPNPILRQTSREVSLAEIQTGQVAFTNHKGKQKVMKLEELVRRMKMTMYHKKGVGLAAPQAGIPLRVIVVDPTGDPSMLSGPSQFKAIINPAIEVLIALKMREHEGCLSVPGRHDEIERYMKIRVSGLNIKGEPLSFEAEGWEARVYQHEVDHLSGKLFIDHVKEK